MAFLGDFGKFTPIGLLTGSDKKSPSPSKKVFAPFTSPGLTASRDKKTGQISVGLGSDTTQALADLQKLREREAGFIESNLALVDPMQNQLLQSRLRTLRTKRGEALDSLRGNLARRRLSGSSFALDQQAMLDKRFASAEADVRAQNMLESMQIRQNLISEATARRVSVVQERLRQADLSAEAAVQLSTGTAANMQSAAQFEAQMAAQAAAGTGEMIGQIAQIAMMA